MVERFALKEKQVKKKVISILEDIEPWALDDTGLHIPDEQIEKAAEKIMCILTDLEAENARLKAELEEYLTVREKELTNAYDEGHYRAMAEHATPWELRAEAAETRLAEALKALDEIAAGDAAAGVEGLMYLAREAAHRIREGGKE